MSRAAPATEAAVLLCHADDAPALWLHAALERAAATRVELVSVESVVYSRRIVHRADSASDTGEVWLADGRVLRCERIAALLNRVRRVPDAHLARAAPADREYAAQEWRAWLAAWLDAVPRVLNPPQAWVLGAARVAPLRAMHLAAMAGLSTGGWRDGTADACGPQAADSPALATGATRASAPPLATRRAIVFDGTLHGDPLPAALHAPCAHLSALLGLPLLQVELHGAGDGPWRFVAADGMPDFRIGGPLLVAALARWVDAGASP